MPSKRYQTDQPVQWDQLSEYFPEMHRQGAVHWNEYYRAWFVVGYEAVKSGLKCSTLSSDIRGILESTIFPRTWVEKAKPLQSFFSQWMIYQPDASHVALRRALSPFFHTSRLEASRPLWMAEANSLLKQALLQPSLEWVSRVIRPFVLRAICHFFDFAMVPEEVFLNASVSLSCYLNAAVRSPAVIKPALSALDDFRQYFTRQQSPVTQALRDADISQETRWITQAMLMIAGVETTSSLLSAMLVDHHQNAIDLNEIDCQEWVQALLRAYTPVHSILRTAKEDFILEDVNIQQREVLCFVLGAANHDPKILDEAMPLLSFGMGPHFCIGRFLGEAIAASWASVLGQHQDELFQRKIDAEWSAGVTFQGFTTIRVSAVGED